MGPLRCEIFFVIEFAETGSSFSESINVHWMPGYLIGMLGLPEGHKASQTHNCWKEILQAKCWTNQISTDIVAVVDTVLQLNTIRSMQLLY